MVLLEKAPLFTTSDTMVDGEISPLNPHEIPVDTNVLWILLSHHSMTTISHSHLLSFDLDLDKSACSMKNHSTTIKTVEITMKLPFNHHKILEITIKPK